MNAKLLLGIALAVVALAIGCSFDAIDPPRAAPPVATYSQQVDGYLAAAPPVFRAGRTENVSVSLFEGSEPAQGTVRLTLLHDNRAVAVTDEDIQGAGAVPLPVPALPDGYDAIDYTLHIEGFDANGPAFTHSSPVRVTEAPGLLFLETDKPIYKPGQHIRIRALRLDADLKPLPGPGGSVNPRRQRHQGL